MRLKEWAEAKGIKPKALGALLGITRPHAWRLLSGDGFPHPPLRRRIYVLTEGAVDANGLADGQDAYLELAPVETLVKEKTLGR